MTNTQKSSTYSTTFFICINHAGEYFELPDNSILLTYSK